MTDCSNAEIRDLLPDYVHDQLNVTDHARVQQHVVSCADCAEELELLQTVLAIRPSVKQPNVADILAKLPKPGQLTSLDNERPRVVAVEGVRDIASAKSVVRKSNTFRNWRAIAAVAVMSVGALSIVMNRKGLVDGALPPIADSSTVATLPERVDNSALVNANDSANSVKQSNTVLSVGDPSELTEEERAAIMSRLDKWDGSASAEPLPGLPILPPGS